MASAATAAVTVATRNSPPTLAARAPATEAIAKLRKPAAAREGRHPCIVPVRSRSEGLRPARPTDRGAGDQRPALAMQECSIPDGPSGLDFHQRWRRRRWVVVLNSNVSDIRCCGSRSFCWKRRGCGTHCIGPGVVHYQFADGGYLQERCIQLIAFFDRYGGSRSENSDGPRNHTRIGAAIDCERGQYLQGIEAMEALLRRKAFVVPRPLDRLNGPQDL